MSVKMKQVTAFLTLLVEWGGRHYVDDDFCIRRTSDDELVEVGVKDDTRPMWVPHEDMRQDPTVKHALFMPLLEMVNESATRKWYFTERQKEVGAIIKACMVTLLKICSGSEDIPNPSLDQMELAQVYNSRFGPTGKTRSSAAGLKKQVDDIDKAIAEVMAIPDMRLCRIIYNRRSKSAQIQTDIYDDEYLTDELGWRKKSLPIIRDMFADIMASENVQEEYVHKAVEMGMPEVECFLNCIRMYSKAVGDYASKLLDITLYPEELDLHMEHLSEYRKSCSHLVGIAVQAAKEERDETNLPKNNETSVSFSDVMGLNRQSDSHISGGVPVYGAPVYPPQQPAGGVMTSVGDMAIRQAQQRAMQQHRYHTSYGNNAGYGYGYGNSGPVIG